MKRCGISFVFPVFNEYENIGRTLRRAETLAGELTDDYEIVVVDDASTDGSTEALRAAAMENPRIRCLCLKANERMGGALKKGLRAASKDIIIYTDFDFPAREEDIKKALKSMDGVDIVTAYSTVTKNESMKRVVISKAYNRLVRALFNLPIRDVNAGLKIFRKRVFEDMDLSSSSPFICAEIFAEALRMGFAIRQYGIVFEPRTRGSSCISRTDVLLRSFADMLAYRFSR
jgi:glycosyltransferase involved in cell wall biosynthesis